MKNVKSLLVFLSIILVASAFAGRDAQPLIERIKVEPIEFNAHTGVMVEPFIRDNAGEYTFEYRWLLNGEDVYFETSPQFPGDALKRGDKLTVEIVPIDYGGSRFEPAIIPDMVVVNASPEITTKPSAVFSPQGFTYQVNATDPDGDTLTYNLEEAPDGMEIDPATGQITWQFDTMPQGVFPVKIIVEDGFDGRAEQTFELNLSLVEKKGTQ